MSSTDKASHPHTGEENTVAEIDAAPPQYQLPPKKSKLGMLWGKLPHSMWRFRIAAALLAC